jgi:glycosyltransferase involved in cell wall biosynthesis
VETLNRHRILVAPSRYQEPFGLVALEGVACGCVAVGSSGADLPEAIGHPCGLTFPNGDVEAMTGCLERALLDPDLRAELRAQAADHLRRHRPEVVAKEYLDVMEVAAR